MKINGIDLYVEQSGEGQPLVLIHGLTVNVEWMRPEIERFSRCRHVIAIDSRGHGRSERPAQFTLDDHISDVIGVMDALNLEKLALMGTSVGTYFAQGVAVRQPERVSKLVLVVPKSNGKSSSTARIISEHAAELKGKSVEEVQAFVFDLMFAPTTPPEIKATQKALMEQDLELELSLTPEQFAAANRALEGFDFRPDLPNVTAETLVISGRYDPLNPPEEGRIIADLIPNARFELMEHSGHLPDLEEPNHLLDLIEAFLQEKQSN